MRNEFCIGGCSTLLPRRVEFCWVAFIVRLKFWKKMTRTCICPKSVDLGDLNCCTLHVRYKKKGLRGRVAFAFDTVHQQQTVTPPSVMALRNLPCSCVIVPVTYNPQEGGQRSQNYKLAGESTADGI